MKETNNAQNIDNIALIINKKSFIISIDFTFLKIGGYYEGFLIYNKSNIINILCIICFFHNCSYSLHDIMLWRIITMMQLYFLLTLKFIFDLFITFLLFVLNTALSVIICIGFIAFFYQVYKLFKKE